MDGFQHLDGWDVALFLAGLASMLVLIVGIPVTIGGLGVWAARRRPPGSGFVRACMITTVVLVSVWGIGLAVSAVSFGPETVTLETIGRICRGGVMGGPTGVCVDMHLCTPVPDSFDTLLTEEEEPVLYELAGCTLGVECELQIVWKAAVRLGDDSDEWIVSADRASIDDPDPAAYPESLIWFVTQGRPADPAQAVPIHNNDAGQLIWSLQNPVRDAYGHFARVYGPPSPRICADYFEDSSERTYEFTSY